MGKESADQMTGSFSGGDVLVHCTLTLGPFS